MYSYHYFLFPFRFDKIVSKIEDRHTFYKNNSFDERVKIDDEFKQKLENNGWEYKKFKIASTFDYNEFVYFHEFVKDALFNTEDFSKNATSYFFEKDVVDGEFKVTIKDKEYNLKLDTLTLRVFDTGVGILALEVENHNYHALEDILKINDFSRRLYPQFLSKSKKSDELSYEIKEKFLPQKVEVSFCGESFCEDFVYKKLPDEPKIASYILGILGGVFTTDRDKIGRYFIQPSIDDRMFVISWYGNNGFSNQLKNYGYETSDKWYEYVFIDGDGKSIQSPQMQKELIKKSTYDRWGGYGTLYGMSRYSFVCLTDSGFGKSLILPHIKSMYYQMFILLFAQRSSILRFSDEVTAISDIEHKNMQEKISNLYKNYIRFVNKLYFREITPQEQGIELYEKAKDILKIDRDIKDLDNEIEELHTYASIIEERKRTEKMDKLSEFGYLVLPATLIASFFGMNTFPEHSIDNMAGFILSFIMMICATVWVSKRYNVFLDKKN